MHFQMKQFAINKFLKMMESAKWQAGQFATFKIFPKWLQFVTSQFLCSSYIKYASQTTEEVLDKLTTDGRLKTVLSAFGGDLGESIGEGSFVMQAAVLGHVLEGCYYPQGGPIQFVRGLIPTIQSTPGGEGNVFVNARVDQILVDDVNTNNKGKKHCDGMDDDDDTSNDQHALINKPFVHRVRLANGDVLSSRLGVVSDCGFRTTLKLLPKNILDRHRDGSAKGSGLSRLIDSVEQSSGGISHVFCFVGLNATNEELNLKSSSYYYIPWNDTDDTTGIDMDATEIQDFYRNTLLDPTVEDVSAGIVFASAKDPIYSREVMPGKSTVIIFSEAKTDDFRQFIPNPGKPSPCGGGRSSRIQGPRTKGYEQAKKLIEKKMIRSLLLNFPHLEPYIDIVEVGTPLTLFDYTRRFETLGLRHTPQRMCDMELRPACEELPGLYFTGT